MIEKPWIVRHKYALLGGGILLLLSPVFIIFAAVFFSPALFFQGFIFLILAGLPLVVGSVFIGAFSAARRFDEILNALGHEVVWAKTSFLSSTIQCETFKHGKFSLRYHRGRKYTPAYYELKVPTAKSLPPDEKIFFDKSDMWFGLELAKETWRLWRKEKLKGPEVKEKIKNYLGSDSQSFKEDSALLSKLPVEKLRELRSLAYIGTEKEGYENMWVARFSDKWRYSETPDITECVKILREVEEKL